MAKTWRNKALEEKARKECVRLVFDRVKEQQPQCEFGLTGVCCKNCFAGPCRIIETKETFYETNPSCKTVKTKTLGKVTERHQGICGAHANTIVARNLLRQVAGGASAHIDHAREALLVLWEVAEGNKQYKIKNESRLRELAKKLKVQSKGPVRKVAKAVALKALEDFQRQENSKETLNWLKITATEERQKKWKELGILPVSADFEVTRAIHQTTMGCDMDPTHLLLSCLRLSLVDGYAGMHLATDMQDILFGTPTLVKSTANLGTLKEDYVNLVVHGHVPLLSEKVVEWAKKLEKEAKKAGAQGINVVGMCCTGNEVLMRLGVPMAGHVLQQEMAIVTGAVDAMVVDTQCIYPSIADVASCYHTKLITTLDFVRFSKATHIPFHAENANKAAKEIVMTAVKNFKNRAKARVMIPQEKSELYGGFSAETIIAALSKLNKKDPLKPLIDNIANGNIKGIAAVIGCRNPKLKGFPFHEELSKILIKNNILVVGTGCWAHAAAQSGLMLPEATNKYAGKTLKAVLTAIGEANNLGGPIPPVLHMGSCVDNSRIETVVNAIAEKLKVPISKLPIAASAPEYMTEKAVAIGTWALSLGIATHLNPVPPVTGSEFVTKVLTEGLEDITGGKVLIGTTPEKAASVMINHIKKKRKELGLKS